MFEGLTALAGSDLNRHAYTLNQYNNTSYTYRPTPSGRGGSRRGLNVLEGHDVRGQSSHCRGTHAATLRSTGTC